MKIKVRKDKIKFSCRFGWFEFWWFPKDWVRRNSGKGYWQIMGHIFCDKPFTNSLFETTWSFGRHCGYTISNWLICIDFGKRKAWSPLLKMIL